MLGGNIQPDRCTMSIVAYAPAAQQGRTRNPHLTHHQHRWCQRASPDHCSGGLYERPQDRRGFMMRLVTSCFTGSSPRTPSGATLLRSLSETASSLRIQGLPHLGHHLKLTRHVSYVCGAVVDGIQHRIPQCEEDNLEAPQSQTENLSQPQPLGTSLKSHLLRPMTSSEGDTRHPCTRSAYVSRTRLVWEIK